jgi:hypothetical protein
MVEIKKTGGARIGMANATWPFATLKANKDRLELNATIIGNLFFKPDDIISIESYGLIPFIGKGIRINHRVDKYKSKVIFWTFDDPRVLIKKIEQTGFLNSKGSISETLEREINELQAQGGFPIKTSAAIGVIIVWNILFSIDFYNFFTSHFEGGPLGIGAKLAIGSLLLTSLALLRLKFIRKLFLKEGHSIDSIKKFIYFIIIICLFFLIIMSFLP